MVKKELHQLVSNKLKEYDISIYNKQQTNKNETIIFSQDMILFVHEEEFSISVSFQATTKPHQASQYTLILCDIDKVNIIIMESFIYTDKNKFVSGDKAYEIVSDSIKKKAMYEYATQEAYTNILENVECFKC